MICDRCYRPADEGEHGLGLCPLEPRRGVTIWADDIPGGLEIAHGLCHENGTPRRYYSRSEIRQAAAVKGVVPYHDIFQEQGNRRLEDARHHEDWLKTSSAARAKRDRDEARQEQRLKAARESRQR